MFFDFQRKHLKLTTEHQDPYFPAAHIHQLHGTIQLCLGCIANWIISEISPDQYASVFHVNLAAARLACLLGQHAAW